MHEAFDPYKSFHKKANTLSDEERMEEFAHTGNPEHLTPELAQRMQIETGPDGKPRSMAGPSDAEVNAKILADHGVDASLLRGKDVRPAMRVLLPVATASVHQHTEPLFDAKDAARDEISRLIFDRPEVAVGTLFKSLDPKNVTAIETARYIQDTLYAIKEDYRAAKELGGPESKRFPKVLQAFQDCAEKAQRDLYLTKNYYGGATLVWHTLNGLYEDIKEGVDRLPELYTSEPFELTTGTYAAFSEDRNRMYVASPEDSAKTHEIFREDLTQPYTTDKKKNRDWRESRAFRLLDIRHSIIDSGTLLTDLYPREFAKDPALLQDFITLTHPSVRKGIESPMSVLLSQLSIREQLQLLKYVRTANSSAFDELRIFGERFREPGLRTFLLTADDKELRQKVYEFTYTRFEGDNRQGYGGYSPVFGQIDKIAHKVFGAYGQLVKSIDSVGDYLREAFGNESSAAAEKIVERQLDRARNLLSSAYDSKSNPDQLLALIENANAENALFLDTYKTIKAENPGLRLEEIPAVQSSIMSGQELLSNQQLLDSVEKIYAKNYQPETAKLLLDRFRESLSDPDSKFDLIAHEFNGQPIPIAFMLTTESGNNRAYVSALNIDQEFAGARPGMILLQKVSAMARDGKVVEAVAAPDIARGYVLGGCVANGIVRDVDGSVDFHVVFDSQINATLRSRDRNAYRTAQFVGMASEAFDPDRAIQVLRPTQKEELTEVLRVPLESGFVVTQFIPHDGTTLAVIEKPEAREEQRLAA
ncbi:hypothetical protein A3H16_04120 [Candidatus Kaiserbacteria bacterium RIFCSPLOWO2_12_FULL_53_8]|uniref:Uncharacterized protein n=2 Tax=Candidatus Kaiseribacteriota TaxID=1752734 RepID=A0A1F6CU98_9BACT|nr:MAG: hypothetical protein A2851_05500 [Candidatus Kaiserbacteria bacterium RIFCSPHIGHO2_01_FULL_53_29]OGG92405.1 MAG: hypothetical protein A3H16_04120 [Candidatus Kaiserbacteria bacterium RIFCSPLOWO2_12_FULL_53_8]